MSTMESKKPTLVFVHGAWLLPSCWDPIVPALQSEGYEVVRPKLPSSGGDPVVPDMTADIGVIRETVGQILDDGKDVVAVFHSYGGMPGGSALEGFDKATRAAAGKESSVIRLVYINSYLVVEGTQLNPKGTRDNMVPAMVTDFDKGIVTVDPTLAQDMIFQDVTGELLEELIQGLVPQSLGVYWDKTTFAAWRYIPTTYVRCMKDMPSTVAATNWLIETAKSSGKHMIDRVIERDVGHCPYLTQPDWTVEMLRQQAGEDI